MIGRDRERSRLHELLLDAPIHGSAVVVRGEAGIGKTTLVDDARATAAALGFRVLTCAGVQSETRAAMAGLQQLLHVAVDRADALPERQRDALRSAFGLGPDTAPDRLIVAVAVLGLLEDLAHERPLLLVLEDLQWMDQPTINMIGFVGRRISESPIVMLATCRTSDPDPIGPLGLPELELHRLAGGDADALLAELNPELRRETRARVLTEAEGNPLALVELSRGLLDRGLHDATTLPSRLPLSARLENAFAAQVAQLPQPTQDLLLLAASSDATTLSELDAAGRALGIDFTALEPAEKAGLVHAAGSELTFRHPLIQSAIYGAASFPRRIAAHRALAEALAGEGSTERVAWHRAAATVGKDEDVARDLESAARQAEARGSMGAAMRSMERAADLSPDPEYRGRRLAAAAGTAQKAGLTTASLRLADEVGRATTDPDVLAGVGLTRALVTMYGNAAAITLPEMVDLAVRAAPTDPQAAANLLTLTAVRGRVDLTHPELAPRVERELMALALHPLDPRILMVRASIDPAGHAGELLPAMRAVTEQLSSMDTGLLTGLAGSFDALHDWALMNRWWKVAIDGYRRAGTVADLASNLTRLARSVAISGHLADALDYAEEAERLAADLDLAIITASGAAAGGHVHAWRGDTEAGAATLARVRRLAPEPQPQLSALMRWNIGLTALVAGRHWEAHTDFDAVVTHPDLGLLTIADLTEAAHRGGDVQRAAARVAEAEEQARPFGAPLLEILLHRSLALLEGSEEHFVAAVGGPDTAVDFPLQVARSRLVYGEWLRRQRRTGPARDELAAAASAFEQAGARPWAARANAELRASGITVHRPADDSATKLTTQELQIARLAATGLSNKEIADQLFLSHRTVGAHLYRIFPKLGISGRAELRDALASP